MCGGSRLVSELSFNTKINVYHVRAIYGQYKSKKKVMGCQQNTSYEI